MLLAQIFSLGPNLRERLTVKMFSSKGLALHGSTSKRFSLLSERASFNKSYLCNIPTFRRSKKATTIVIFTCIYICRERERYQKRGREVAKQYSTRLTIGKSQVQSPAEVAGDFSSLQLTFCALISKAHKRLKERF